MWVSHHIWCGLQPARTVAKRLTVAGKKGSTICCRCQQGGYGGSSGFVAAGAVGLYGLPSYAGGTAASRNPGRFTMGGRRSRVDRREMASAARTSLYREHGGGTGRKVAARPNRARSVAGARRSVDAMLDFELYSTHLHEPMGATVYDATAESHR